MNVYIWLKLKRRRRRLILWLSSVLFPDPTSGLSLVMLCQGMTEAEEDKLLALKDFMLKSNKAKANMGEQSHLGEAAQTGVIDLATLGITGRQVDLVKPKAEPEDKRGNPHPDWHYNTLHVCTALSLLQISVSCLNVFLYLFPRVHCCSIWCLVSCDFSLKLHASFESTKLFVKLKMPSSMLLPHVAAS